MKILLLLPLLLGFSVPAIAHNEANGGDAMHADGTVQEIKGVPVNWSVFGKAKSDHCYKTDK